MTRPLKNFLFPKWFDLKNYDDAETLDQEGWLLQFCARGLISKAANDTTRSPGDNWLDGWCYKNLDESLVLIKARIRKNGILKPEDMPEGYFEPANPNGVELYSFEEMKKLTQNKFYEGGVKLHETGFLAVNPRLPWKVLVGQIKLAVEKLQKPFHDDLKKQITPKEWAKMRLLPFIDLQQWAKETGDIIPTAVLTRKLFPHSLDGVGGNSDAIRKLKALMPKVLENRFLLHMGVITPPEK